MTSWDPTFTVNHTSCSIRCSTSKRKVKPHCKSQYKKWSLQTKLRGACDPELVPRNEQPIDHTASSIRFYIRWIKTKVRAGTKKNKVKGVHAYVKIVSSNLIAQAAGKQLTCNYVKFSTNIMTILYEKNQWSQNTCGQSWNG